MCYKTAAEAAAGTCIYQNMFHAFRGDVFFWCRRPAVTPHWKFVCLCAYYLCKRGTHLGGRKTTGAVLLSLLAAGRPPYLPQVPTLAVC